MKIQKRKFDGLDILCQVVQKTSRKISRKASIPPTIPLENVISHEKVERFFKDCRAANFSITAGIFHLCFCSENGSMPENIWVKEKELRDILNFKTSVEMRHVYTNSKFDYRPESSRFCGVQRSNDLPKKWKITDKSRARQCCVLCHPYDAISRTF